MSREHQAQFTRSGGMLQSAIPKKPVPQANMLSSQGLLLRGVILATYVLDDSDHPFADSDQPVAVYCDVLTYSNMTGIRNRFIRQALVLQDRGAMHSGRVWKPRATTMRISTGELDPLKGTNPADMDGDHVLVGFMHNQLFEPIILAGLPHPSADVGNEDRATGNRLRLKLSDGDPDFWKHHGSFYGINDSGDFVTDTRFANDGSLEEEGEEPAPPTDGKGSQLYELPLDAAHEVQFYDMSDPDNPEVKVALTFDKKKWELEFIDSGLKVLVDDDNGKIELGAEGADDKAVLNSKLRDELDRIRDLHNDTVDAIAKSRRPVNMYIPPLIPNFGKPLDQLIASSIDYLTGTNIALGEEAKIGPAPIDADADTGEFVPPIPFDPDNPLRESGLFPGSTPVGDTNSDLVTIDK